jgi:hypothetical protein
LAFHLDETKALSFMVLPHRHAGEDPGEFLNLDAGEDRRRTRELAGAGIEALDAKIAELNRARAG